MTETIMLTVTRIIEIVGYFGVTILMILESTMMPLPSELVMPFAGFLVYEAKMNIWGVIIASTAGSLIGSGISYFIGYKYGYGFTEKVGRYFFLNKEHLEKARHWFAKYGGITIFVSRFIPGVRHVISIPAGVGKMNFRNFIIFTALGAGSWNTILTVAGYMLKQKWEVIHKYSSYVDMVLVVLILILAVYWIYKLIRLRRRPCV
jgi:membrane protein DedA with SNARE-associated domain